MATDDREFPIVSRGDVIGKALVNPEGNIISIEIDDDFSWVFESGIRLGAIKSFSLIPNYNGPSTLNKENNNARTS